MTTPTDIATAPADPAGASDPTAAPDANTASDATTALDATAAPADVIDALLNGLTAAEASIVSELRARRPITIAQAQASHDALFAGVPADADVSRADRIAIAVFTARLHGDEHAADRYRSLAGDDDARLTAIGAAAASAAVHGPYGRFPSAELAAFDQAGPTYRAPADLVERIGARLAAALEYAHALVFHPRDATPDWPAALTDAGWSASAVVTISQEVAFLTFQLRVAAGLAALVGSPLVHAEPVARRAGSAAGTDGAVKRGTPDAASDASTARRPTRFTTAQLDWDAWVPPVEESALSDVQRDALVDAGRAKSPYFRLLARDPAILKARTLADKDIFYNTVDGLPRAERELSAAATSRVNGCIYCASVHSRFAAHYGKRPDDVQRLLDEGVAGAQEPRWRALIDGAAALAQTPPAFTPAHADALRAEGLADAEISDAIHAAAFFAWANRLMLALGEPRVP
ncbi:alkylhydroperoxidase domain protein [Microbacterium kribbense]|uniref:Alkylhydroperoxidase domain protein n=1 Tax=Microbacterium kribbense TaxID=433645 RepID=A0ABP7G380_9MICO